MIKSELIERIAERNPHLYQRDVEHIVDAILEEVVVALSRCDRVELRGFGAFSVRSRRARTGRNPRTGEAIPIKARHVVTFHASHKLKGVVQGDTPVADDFE